MSRGIIEAQTLRSEQFEFEARTSDPSDAQPGEYWIRTDQTGANPDVIAELRRQDNSGVTTCPIFAAAEESNLGADVTRGPSVVLDDGSVGFVAMTTGSGEVGSPRAVTSAGTQYVSHNALKLNLIPDSVDLYWPADEGSGTTLNPDIGSVTITLPSDSWVSDSDFVGGTAPDLTNNFQSDSDIEVNQTQFTVIFWTSFDSYKGSFETFAESGASGDGTPSEGWAIKSDGGSTQVKLESYSSSNGFEGQQKDLTCPDLTKNDIMFALAGNENLSNNYRLEIYTRSQHEYTHTFSLTRSTKTNSPFMLNSNGWDGKFDGIGVAEGTEMPKSDMDEYWDITR